MKKKSYLLGISLFLAVSSLTGCDFKTVTEPSDDDESSEYKPDDDPIIPEGELLEAPFWATNEEDLLNYDHEVALSNNASLDEETDYRFYLELNEGASLSGAPETYVRVYDSTHIEHSLTSENIGGGVYGFDAVIPYEEGRFYTIELKDGAPFHFYQKDESIREFHFDTKAEEKDTYEVNNDVKRFLLSDIISRQDISSSGPHETHTMITKKSLNLQPGEQFLFWNGEKIDNNAFYGTFAGEKIVSSGQNEVSYTDPELGKIFGDSGLNAFFDDYDDGMIEDLELCSEKSIVENLQQSEEFRDFIMEQYEQYVPEEQRAVRAGDVQTFLDLLKNIKLKPKFGFDWPGWSFDLIISVTIPTKYVSVTIMIEYYRKSVLKVDASCSLRKFLGTPYWADIAVDISETVETSFRFQIAVGGQVPVPSGNNQTDFNHLSSYIYDKAEQYEKADSHFDSVVKSKKDAVNFDGKAVKIKLGTGRWPIGGIFDLFLDFNFVIKIDAQVMVNYTYTSKSVNHIISYRSGDDSKSSKTTDSLETSAHSLAIIGSIGVDVGLHLRFGLGVCGLEDYINLSVYADVGVYMVLSGFGTIMWSNGPTGKSCEADIAFSFEVGWYADVGVSLVIFFVDLSADLFKIRKPFFNVNNADYVVEAPTFDGPIELEKEITKVKDDLHLLNLSTISGTAFKIVQTEYDPVKDIKYVNDRGETVKGCPFSFSFESGSYIAYSNGALILKSNHPIEFNDTLYVDVPRSMFKLKEGQHHFIEVRLHYLDPMARPVYFDDQYMGYYTLGNAITIPDCPKDREEEGKRFYGWLNTENGSIYEAGETFVVPQAPHEKHEPLRFTSYYFDVIYHTVKFYDGLNNLVKEQVVEEGLDATAPSAAERDRFMPSNAVFMGWSTSFTGVYYDLEVYGIYIYEESEGN